MGKIIGLAIIAELMGSAAIAHASAFIDENGDQCARTLDARHDTSIVCGENTSTMPGPGTRQPDVSGMNNDADQRDIDTPSPPHHNFDPTLPRPSVHQDQPSMQPVALDSLIAGTWHTR